MAIQHSDPKVPVMQTPTLRHHSVIAAVSSIALAVMISASVSVLTAPASAAALESPTFGGQGGSPAHALTMSGSIEAGDDVRVRKTIARLPVAEIGALVKR